MPSATRGSADRGPEDNVGSENGDVTFTQFCEKVLAQPVALLRIECIDGGPIAGAEHDVPKVVGPFEVVAAFDRLHCGSGYTSVGEQIR